MRQAAKFSTPKRGILLRLPALRKDREHLEFVDPLPDDLSKPLASIEDRSMSRTEAGDEVFAVLAQGRKP